MHGLHLTADLHNCRCELLWLLDAARTESACVQAVRAAGLQPVAQLHHAFPATPEGPSGFTATVLLSESHLCLHTWPEQQAVTLDVYVCNFGADHSLKAHTLMDTLIALFQPARVERHALMRGTLPRAMPPLQPAPAAQPVAASPAMSAGHVAAPVPVAVDGVCA